jgi:hypothetical protein
LLIKSWLCHAEERIGPPKRHLSKKKPLRSFIRIGPPKRKDPSYRQDDKPLTLLSNKCVLLLIIRTSCADKQVNAVLKVKRKEERKN